jgi:sulfate permease, SulP family
MMIDKERVVKDLLAGLTVSFAALSLGAAFGAMSGRGAFAGMVGAAVIPVVTSLLGGTRLQASGPTAPMTAITALVVARAYELFPERQLAEQFITLVILLSGAFMALAGLARLGRLIALVPNVVIFGFMNGIAGLIWYDQVVKLAGSSTRPPLLGHPLVNLAVVVATVASIFLVPVAVKSAGVGARYRSFFSALLIAIVGMTLASQLLGLEVQKVELGSSVSSLADYWHLVKGYFPTGEIFSAPHLAKALPLALQLTLLGYLDSLLTALVIDKMTKTQSNLNQELMAQGLANTLAGLVQGIPGAQATIRSVLLVKENAQTRLAGVSLGVFVLLSLLFFKDLFLYVPSAVLVGVLIKAGWDVCDREHLAAYFQKGWYRQPVRNFQLGLVMYTTLVTVVVDLNVAVISGTLIFYAATRWFKSLGLKDLEGEVEAD